MSQRFVTPVAPFAPTYADFANIAADIATPQVNVDFSHYGAADLGFVTLNAGVLPGSTYAVTGGTWVSGTATLTIGTSSFPVNQLITVAGITPSGYNTAFVAVSTASSTVVKYLLTADPGGAWASGGIVKSDGVSAANGMIALDTADNAVKIYNGTAWGTIGGSAALADPGANGIVKRTALNVTSTATAGTDFVAPVNAPSAWIAVATASFQNSWVNFGAPYSTAQYKLDALGCVSIRGTIKSGTTTDGTILFNLPSGYRPPADVAYAVSAGGGSAGFAQVVVTSGGDVKIYSTPGSSFVHIIGRFSVES